MSSEQNDFEEPPLVPIVVEENFDIIQDFLITDNTSINNDDDNNYIGTFSALQELVSNKQLTTPLECSNIIIITGTVHADCERFDINLVCGGNIESPDLALHINPRFERRYIVRNHRVNGKWGQEDTGGKHKFNLKRGSAFSIHILVGEVCYFISVNDEHMCSFPFKIPIRKVTQIEVCGGVLVDDIVINKIKSYPTDLINRLYQLKLNEIKFDIDELPYTCKLASNFDQGHEINIEGTVKLLPIAFLINLQNSANVWPHPIIPLHINARFGQKAGEVYLIRNSWYNGQWAAEERAITNKFIPGRKFLFSIKYEQDTFTVWINNLLIATYRCQINFQLASYLYIEGDIYVQSITHSNTNENKSLPTSPVRQSAH